MALAVTVAAGLGVREVADGAFAKYAGVALYATAVYWCVALVAPKARIAVVAIVAVVLCWAVEVFQLTPVPRELSAHSMLARLVLGSTFSGWDLVTYPVGVLLGCAVHRRLAR